MMGGGNPFPVGGMTPVQTASGQIQFQTAGGFSGGNNQMDLLFNRKVVKPIRGGAAAQSSSGKRAREGSNSRQSHQLTFNEFMQSQQQPLAGNYKSVGRASVGRASVGAMRSPIRGGGGGAPPLVRPENRKEYQEKMRSMSNKKGVAKQIKQYQANMNASRQMVQQMKMQEAQALAEIPLEETLVSESSSDNDKNKDDDSDGDSTPRDDEYDEEQDKAEVERQIKRARYAS